MPSRELLPVLDQGAGLSPPCTALFGFGISGYTYSANSDGVYLAAYGGGNSAFDQNLAHLVFVNGYAGTANTCLVFAENQNSSGTGGGTAYGLRGEASGVNKVNVGVRGKSSGASLLNVGTVGRASGGTKNAGGFFTDSATVDPSTGVVQSACIYLYSAGGALIRGDLVGVQEFLVDALGRIFGSVLSGTVSLRASLTADVNDYTLPTARHIYTLTDGVADRTITGLAAPTTTPTGGYEVYIVNTDTAKNIILAHQNTGSAAANRFLCSTGANVTLGPNQRAALVYDATAQRWRVFS